MRSVFLLLCCALFLSQAAGQTRILLEPGETVIEFDAAESIALSRFALETSVTLGGDWAVQPGAVFGSLGGTRYSARLGRDGSARLFYRVTLDGEVIAITFAEPVNLVTEGENSSVRVDFSAPFSGILNYTIRLVGQPDFVGQVLVDNAIFALIPVDLAVLGIVDDASVDPGRFATVTVQPDALENATATIAVVENDEIWDGVLQTEDGGELTFCLEHLRPGGEAPTLNLANLDNGGFLPPGRGRVVSAPVFDAAQIAVELDSATLPATQSPLGLASYYKVALAGTLAPESGGTVYEGNAFGDAVLTLIVGQDAPRPTPAGDDALEPNDSVVEAAPLGSLEPGDLPLVIEGLNTFANEDFYTLSSTQATGLTVRVEFLHSEGDIDLDIRGPAGGVLDLSEGVSNAEEVSVQASAGETYTIRVYGFSGANNHYRLLIGNPDVPASAPAPHLNTVKNARFVIVKRPPEPQAGSAPLLPAN